MQSSEQIKIETENIDSTLLIARLEKEVLENPNSEKTVEILREEKYWKPLPVEYRIRWAHLAQMAGDMDTALAVFSHVNTSNPDASEAWTEKFELLQILDRREELAAALALAKPHLSPEAYGELIKKTVGPNLQEDESDIRKITEPFERMRRRQDLLQHYLNLFSGREDCFARQWVNKKEGKQGYVPVRHPMTVKDIEDHLTGHKTYGIYLVRSDSTVRLAAVDADLIAEYRLEKIPAETKHHILRERTYLVSQIKEIGKKLNLSPMAEFSGGKGFHFWFFFSEPVAAGRVKSIFEQEISVLSKDLSAFKLEVFPKQAGLSGKGLGNLVKLPLGIHRLTGRRSRFMGCPNRSIDEQLEFLSTVSGQSPRGLFFRENQIERKKILVHPRFEKQAEKYSEVFILENRCPPIARIMSACRNKDPLSAKEQKILFQTIGFLPRAKRLLHYLMEQTSDYNIHLVDYQLSKIRGTPLGCRRIHSMTGYTQTFCEFDTDFDYYHPLLHLKEWKKTESPKSEKVENLASALDSLNTAISQVRHFLK